MSLLFADPCDVFDPFAALVASRYPASAASNKKGANKKSAEPRVAVQWQPVCDITETTSSYLLEAELPGVSKDSIKLNFDDGVLKLSGERKVRAHSGANQLRERLRGHFERHFILPEGVDATGITASFQDGVLEVTVPKPVPVQPKSISITVRGCSPSPATSAAQAPAVATPPPTLTPPPSSASSSTPAESTAVPVTSAVKSDA
jgi:HSP20 family protein